MAFTGFWDKWQNTPWTELIPDTEVRRKWLALTQGQRDDIKAKLFAEAGRAAVGDAFGRGGLEALWRTTPDAPAMRIATAAAKLVDPGIAAYLPKPAAAATAAPAAGMAGKWAAALAIMRQADFNPFGGANATPFLPGFVVDASKPMLPGHKTVILGGAASGIDNKDTIIAALNRAGALYDPAIADPYARTWYVPEDAADTIPKPLNKDNKAGGLGEKLVLGALGAIATAGVMAAASGTAAASGAGWNPVVDVAQHVTANTATTTAATVAEAAAGNVATIGETAVDDLLFQPYEPSAFDLTGLDAGGADLVADYAAESAGALDWLRLDQVDSIFGQVAGTAGRGAAIGGNASKGLPILDSAGSLIKSAGPLITSLGNAFGGNAKGQNTTPNPTGTIGRLNAGTLALLGVGAFLLWRA